MKTEVKSIFDKGILGPLVTLSPDRKAVDFRWIYRLKDDGRFHGRLVTKGYIQIEGLDYDETYAPVIRYETLRILLAEAAAHSLLLLHANIHVAFFNSDLYHEIYIRQPRGFEIPGQEDKVYHLLKAIYSLKQSGNAWYHKLFTTIKAKNFKQCDIDPCIYLDINTGVIVAIYVDDILFLDKDRKNIFKTFDQLTVHFEMKLLGDAKTFLGLQI